MLRNLPSYEKANVLSHALGLLFGLVALPMLVMKAESEYFGLIVFSFSFLFMYTASTVYHLMNNDIAKRRWRAVDHISIFFLIAGTYTPFLLTYLNNPKGDLLLQILWGCAGLGTIFKIFFVGKFKIVSTLIYLAMGWVAIFVINDFLQTMPSNVLLFIGLGGVFYTIGTIFYLWKKPTYNHAVWHLFVLGGSISHWWAIWLSNS